MVSKNKNVEVDNIKKLEQIVNKALEITKKELKTYPKRYKNDFLLVYSNFLNVLDELIIEISDGELSIGKIRKPIPTD
jgi:hypothetical protein